MAARRCSDSASRNNTPARAARPIATITEIGVAKPSAQGQAMISTATALASAKANAGGGPNAIQAMKVMTETAMTPGTNQEATASARLWIGARLRCVFATRA